MIVILMVLLINSVIQLLVCVNVNRMLLDNVVISVRYFDRNLSALILYLNLLGKSLWFAWKFSGRLSSMFLSSRWFLFSSMWYKHRSMSLSRRYDWPTMWYSSTRNLLCWFKILYIWSWISTSRRKGMFNHDNYH